MRLKTITFLRQATSLRRTDEPEITFKPLTCFRYLSKHVSAQRKKATADAGNGSTQQLWSHRLHRVLVQSVCGSGGRCAEVEAEVMGGAVVVGGGAAPAAQISSMDSAGTRPLFFPLLTFRNISPSSNFPTQI